MEDFQFLVKDLMGQPTRERCLLLQQYVFFFFLIFFLVINNHRKDGVSVFCSDNLMDVHVILFYYLQSMPQSQSQTVVVENPMSVDSSGKLVNVIAFH
jgi:hypothetical protein